MTFPPFPGPSSTKIIRGRWVHGPRHLSTRVHDEGRRKSVVGMLHSYIRKGEVSRLLISSRLGWQDSSVSIKYFGGPRSLSRLRIWSRER